MFSLPESLVHCKHRDKGELVVRGNSLHEVQQPRLSAETVGKAVGEKLVKGELYIVLYGMETV